MVERFGWQARRFRKRGFGAGDNGGEFASFVSPLDETDFADHVVLEVGCGTGRWAVAATKWGALDVLAVDISEAVEAAYENSQNFLNLHVIQADIHRLPFRCDSAGQVDLAMSIGVLHHLENSTHGLRALAEVTRPGGIVMSWVYAAEGNAWLARIVDPVRSRVTSRLPLPVVSAMAWALSVIVHPIAKAIGTGRLLPSRASIGYRGYIEWLARQHFPHTHAVIHDHLAAPRTRYVPRGEFEDWFRSSELHEPVLRHRNRNSWTGFARRKMAAEDLL
jgi:SAM-dependent methyltransferase